MDAFNWAGLDDLLNLVFGGTFLVNDLRLSGVFVEFKDLWTELLAGTAADTFLFIYKNLTCHENLLCLYFRLKYQRWHEKVNCHLFTARR